MTVYKRGSRPRLYQRERKIYMNTGTIQEFFDTMDPFEEPLEEKLILNDTYFAAARDSVTVDGMEFTFLKPPYMNFDDHIRTKRKLREAYSQ